MIEVAVKNTDRKLKVDDDVAYKLRNSDLRYYNDNKVGYIAVLTKDKKYIRLTSYITGNSYHNFTYRDGDIFNVTRSNLVVSLMRGKEQIRDGRNYTITCGKKVFKFDKEDFDILKDYSLNCTRYVSVTPLAKLRNQMNKSTSFSLKKLLFKYDTHAQVIFKNGDNTDYRRNNIIVKENTYCLGEPVIVKGNYRGVKAYKDMYIVRESSNPSGVYVRCTYIEAAMVYNYLRRKSGGHIKYINYTGYSEEEENKKAEYILKHKKYNSSTVKYKNASSQYLGVSWDKNLNKWMCRATFLGKNCYLGVYTDEKEAARAYNKKATELLGSKATLNKV